jgi:glycosyltransferase involved in cell wall biosynthesis
MKILIVGNFGNNKTKINGQTIKTLELFNYLNSFDHHIIKENTADWKIFNLPLKIFNLIIAYFKSDKIVILPAKLSLMLIIPLLFLLKLFIRKEVHYIVIGAWLGVFLVKHFLIRSLFVAINFIYVETTSLKNDLLKLNIKGLVIMKNFKKMKSNNILYHTYNNENFIVTYPLKICTFSRVTKLKGILDIVEVVKSINSRSTHPIYTLDIYGPIDKDFEIELFASLDNNINYSGSVDQDSIIKVLSKYFFLVFPTKIRTEGHPGTIIDAYSASLPVVASSWNSVDDFVDSSSGFIYKINDLSMLEAILSKIAYNPSLIYEKKAFCLNKSKEYSIETACSPLILNLFQKLEQKVK